MITRQMPTKASNVMTCFSGKSHFLYTLFSIFRTGQNEYLRLQSFCHVIMLEINNSGKIFRIFEKSSSAEYLLILIPITFCNIDAFCKMNKICQDERKYSRGCILKVTLITCLLLDLIQVASHFLTRESCSRQNYTYLYTDKFTCS